MTIRHSLCLCRNLRDCLHVCELPLRDFSAGIRFLGFRILLEFKKTNLPIPADDMAVDSS